MYEDFMPTREPVTPEYALDVLRDAHRQQCQHDPEADPDVELSFATTVAEWRQACDLLPWRQVADAYNLWWDFQCSHEEWHDALEPAKLRTLADVCSLLARHAKLPRTRPAKVLGAPCLCGGTFLTIRSLLREAGADIAEIAPSTPLGFYARRYLHVFLGPISWLAPGALPAVKIHHPVYDSAVWGCLVGLLSGVIGACASLPWVAIGGGLVFVVSYSMTWIAARCLGPRRVDFGDLKTFRDLTTVVASHVRI